MSAGQSTVVVARRGVLRAASLAGLGIAAGTLTAAPSFGAADDTQETTGELVKRLLGRTAVESPQIHLDMPPVFGNGYSVPLTLSVDSPMTESDHVRRVHVLAPRNPIIVVAVFEFTSRSGRAAVSTRIRLSEPQTVLAVADMSDGALLVARTRVAVDSNGCA
jgi:sulfur-oxidizing protein SoxY